MVTPTMELEVLTAVKECEVMTPSKESDVTPTKESETLDCVCDNKCGRYYVSER